jgi:hypothetical protein
MHEFQEGLMSHIRFLITSFIVLAVVAVMVRVEAMAYEGGVTPQAVDGGEVYSPFVGRDYPDQVLIGDLHFHTEKSFDAGLIGTSLTMHDAFRVARGEKIISNTGQPVQIIKGWIDAKGKTHERIYDIAV